MLKLSHYIIGTLVHLTCNSPSNDCSQDISTTMFAKLLYLALMEDLENVCCFLHYQVIKFDAK